MTKPNYDPNYKVTSDPLFQQMMTERNLSKGSIKAYRIALQNYCNYNQLTLTELYNEADNEEEQLIRAKNRTIIKRLRGFRTYLIQQEYESITIKHYYAAAKSFYLHYLIEIPHIPPVKLKTKQVMDSDIPKKEHIIEALKYTNNLKHIAIIYFMASSGQSRQETVSLTIQDFIDATYEYHESTNIPDALTKLEGMDNVIPLFKMTRGKTSYKYYTCCTPEAVTHILRYLKTRNYKKLRPTEKLFDLTTPAITIFYRRLNNKCNYPQKFLHPHNIRKYHTDIIGDYEFASRLQGRKPKYLQEVYQKANPEKIKQRYIKHLEDLTLQPTHVITIESDEVKELKKQHRREMREFETKMKKEMQNMIQDFIKNQKII